METPSEIVDFLADNQNIPSRYEDSVAYLENSDPTTPLKPETQRFPVLVPTTFSIPDRADPSTMDFDNYMVSRDWMTYAQEPLPPPEPPMSALMPNYDRTKYRMPKFTAIIFRQSPARAQTYVAEFLQKEGWFDQEGWKITGDWFPDDKFSNGKEAVVGDGVKWSSAPGARRTTCGRPTAMPTASTFHPKLSKAWRTPRRPFARRTG